MRSRSLARGEVRLPIGILSPCCFHGAHEQGLSPKRRTLDHRLAVVRSFPDQLPGPLQPLAGAADDFPRPGAGPESKGVLLSAFFWSYALMQIPVGWAADRVNLRWLYFAAFVLWSLGQGLTGFAGSLGC